MVENDGTRHAPSVVHRPERGSIGVQIFSDAE